ncbi:arsenicals resistance [Paramarasmius palmivorus]|uniref:Arsenicals resistance n=1 Tax=Paramarasmius palmivorus TaxID=297713 RepID=A0AAW0DEW1_9AGAR
MAEKQAVTPETEQANLNMQPEQQTQPKNLVSQLGVLDRLLTPIILVCMVIGVILGNYVNGVQEAFNTVQFHNVSFPIALGLLVMMYPTLTKVQYETLPSLFASRATYTHIFISLVLNWLIGPFIMLGVAWATLPDLPTYRTGLLLVGLARCIAMVMIWNGLARGHQEYCAILVVINSALQVVLYSPLAVLFVNIFGGAEGRIKLNYGDVAISVLIYLGIPLVAGVITRYTVWLLFSKEFLDRRFLPAFSPLALIGLLYTIIVMFAYQGKNIVHNLGPVFRVFVPMILYFAIMWTSAFVLVYRLHLREARRGVDPAKFKFKYDMAVVQAFTAGSNNFELAIAVAIAVFGVGSDQALAATIGPLVEVPVLLLLTWVALWARGRFFERGHDVPC